MTTRSHDGKQQNRIQVLEDVEQVAMLEMVPAWRGMWLPGIMSAPTGGSIGHSQLGDFP